MFSDGHRVLSLCNTRLRLLYFLNRLTTINTLFLLKESVRLEGLSASGQGFKTKSDRGSSNFGFPWTKTKNQRNFK